MGIADWIDKNADSLGITMMGIGESLMAADQGRAPNLAPFMSRLQDVGRQRRMQGLSEKLLSSGDLGLTPQQRTILGSMMEIQPDAGMSVLMNRAFPKPREMTDQQRLFEMIRPENRQSAARVQLGLDPRAQAPGLHNVGGNLVDGNGQVIYQGPERPQQMPSRIREAQYLYPNDPEKQRQYIEQSATRPLVSMGSNQNEFAKKTAGIFAERYNGYLEGAENAQNSLNNFGEMRGLLSNADMATGMGAEVILSGKRALQALGVDVGGIADAESFIAMSSRAALDALGDLKGVASDTDMRVVMNTAARVTDTKEGALAKIAVAERAAQYRVAVANAASEYVSAHGQLDAGWLARLNEMSGEFRREVLGILQGSEAFTGYRREDAMNRLQQLRSEGRSDEEIKRILMQEGLL